MAAAAASASRRSSVAATELFELGNPGFEHRLAGDRLLGGAARRFCLRQVLGERRALGAFLRKLFLEFRLPRDSRLGHRLAFCEAGRKLRFAFVEPLCCGNAFGLPDLADFVERGCDVAQFLLQRVARVNHVRQADLELLAALRELVGGSRRFRLAPFFCGSDGAFEIGNLGFERRLVSNRRF